MKRIEVLENQRALVLKGGKIQSILGPGRHWIWDLKIAPATVYKYDVTQPEFSSIWSPVLIRNHPQMVEENFVLADIPDDQIALIYFDGKFARMLSPGQRVLFWKVLKEVRVEYLPFAAYQKIDPELAKNIARRCPEDDLFIQKLIPEGHVGLLFVDGRLVDTLPAGAHAYWKGRSTLEIAVIDLRTQNIEITGQEILTKDRVSLRLNLEAYYRVTDPAKILTAMKDAKDFLYKELQFALRKSVGLRTLDEVLSAKETLGEEIGRAVRDQANQIGAELVSTGVKDMILPGDIREIMNQVVASEKQAQANLIRRREEVAATRALLNTARMIESSPTLMRLKEMETLENVSGKIQSINVIGGLEQIVSQLRGK